MKLVYLFLILLLASCEQPDATAMRNHLNGYWQIDYVETVQGERKEYVANTNYDYYKLSDSTGVRYKVQPSITGSFKTTDAPVRFRVSEKNNELHLTYTLVNEEVTDRIVSCTATQMTLIATRDGKSENGITYHYKRVPHE